MKDLKNRIFNKKLIVSIVALVLILSTMLVSTYAWVETVSTIRIYTGSNGTASKTGTIMTHDYQKASISAGASSGIDISKMYHEAGDFHLAPASSSDGKNIIFPAAKGQSTNYRVATSSDNMVNYVSFSFKVAQATNFVFNSNPTISFDGTAISSSLVRMSLTVGTGSAKIFAKAAASNETVINSASGGTGTTNVYAFSSYVSGNNQLALQTTEANQVVTVKIWIQDPTFARQSTYLGKKLTISNLKLVPAYQVKSIVSVNGTAATNTSVGSVKTGNGTTSYQSTAYYKYGSNASLTATLVDSTNYVFAGWGTTVNTTSYESTNNPYTKTNITTAITRYAIFRQKLTITAKAVPASGTTASTTYGTVQVGSNTSGATSSGTYPYGTSVTLTATAATNYTFVGWYNSSNSGNALSTSSSYTVTATAAATYCARFMSNPTITAKAVLGTGTTASSTYGTVKVGSAAAGATSSARVAYNGNVTLTATPTSNYAIVGWYKGTPSSSTFVTGSNGSTSLTVNNVTADATYYCSFKQKTTTTIYMLDRGYSDMRIYVWGKSTNQTYSAAFGNTGGTALTFDKARGLYSFTFTTGEDEQIGIIVSDGGSTTNRSEYTATIGNTCFIGKSGSSINTSYSLGTKRYFYFTNNYSWSGTIYCHYWGGTGSSWPGSAMTSCYTNSQSQTVYYIERDTANTGIIFNNNSKQTVDITTSTSNCRYYINGQDGSKYTVGTW